VVAIADLDQASGLESGVLGNGSSLVAQRLPTILEVLSGLLLDHALSGQNPAVLGPVRRRHLRASHPGNGIDGEVSLPKTPAGHSNLDRPSDAMPTLVS
jgi:hypothetical protein